MNGRNTEEPGSEAERAFVEWITGGQGTPVTDAQSGSDALRQTAEGDGETVPVPGTERTYTAHELQNARLDEALKRGVSREDLRDYLEFLTGDTPEEIAASAEKIDRLNARTIAAQPGYDEFAGMDPVEAGTYHMLKNLR